MTRAPAPGDAAVPVDTIVRATFDEALDPASVDGTSVALERVAGGATVAASVSLDGAGGTVTLTPDVELEGDTQYRARITTEVADLAGNRLESEISWTFWVNAAPELQLISPTQGQPYVVGETIDVEMAAEDPEEGPLSGADITWQVIQHHTGHLHYGAIREGANGSFEVDDHGDDSYLEIVATATDSRGATTTTSAALNPTVAPVTITSTPPGVTVVVNGEAHETPYSWSSIVNGSHTVVAPATVATAGVERSFVQWDDGTTQTSSIQYQWTTTPTGHSLSASYDVPPDGDPPTLASRYPAPGASGVAAGDDVSVAFSEAIDPATIDESSFSLAPSGGGSPLSGTIEASAGNTSFTLDPDADLAPDTTYTVTLTGAIEDTAGNPLASAPITWDFTTAADDPPPGGSGAYLASDGQVVIEAESADQAIARQGQSWAPGGPAGAVGGAVTLAPDSGEGYSAAEAPTQAPELVFDVDFDQAGTWMVHVRGNPVDTAGNSIHMGLDGQVQPSADNISAGGFGTWGWFNWTSGGPSAAFLNVPSPGVHTVHVWGREDGMSLDRIVLQTQGAGPTGDGPPESARDTAGPDTTPPTLQSRTPVIDATDVAVDTDVSATFSEAIDPATITASSVTLTAGTTPVPATRTLTGAGTTLTLDPDADLAPDTTYTVTLTGAIEDTAGNPLASAPITWDFTTAADDPPPGDTTPPTLQSRTPVIDATDVAVDTDVSATFSEAIDPATITASSVTLTAGTTPVPATRTLTGAGTTLTLDPDADLAPDTTYTVTLTGAIEDTAGNPLASAPITWDFTTAADDPPPGGSGAYLASDGQVVIEAESADQAIARSGPVVGTWRPGGRRRWRGDPRPRLGRGLLGRRGTHPGTRAGVRRGLRPGRHVDGPRARQPRRHRGQLDPHGARRPGAALGRQHLGRWLWHLGLVQLDLGRPERGLPERPEPGGAHRARVGPRGRHVARSDRPADPGGGADRRRTARERPRHRGPRHHTPHAPEPHTGDRRHRRGR